MWKLAISYYLTERGEGCSSNEKKYVERVGGKGGGQQRFPMPKNLCACVFAPAPSVPCCTPTAVTMAGEIGRAKG